MKRTSRAVFVLFYSLALLLVALAPGCQTGRRLEPGGAYAPVISGVTNYDALLFLADSTYDLSYNTVLTVCAIEKKNRAVLRQQFPTLKGELDHIRDQVWEIDGRWALARRAYLANPVPENLDTLNRIVSELQRAAAISETLIQPTP